MHVRNVAETNLPSSAASDGEAQNDRRPQYVKERGRSFVVEDLGTSYPKQTSPAYPLRLRHYLCPPVHRSFVLINSAKCSRHRIPSAAATALWAVVQCTSNPVL